MLTFYFNIFRRPLVLGELLDKSSTNNTCNIIFAQLLDIKFRTSALNDSKNQCYHIYVLQIWPESQTSNTFTLWPDAFELQTILGPVHRMAQNNLENKVPNKVQLEFPSPKFYSVSLYN